MTTEQTLTNALEATDALRMELFAGSDQSIASALALATAFAMQSRTIWRALGGSKMSAAQFYGLADSEAAP